MITSRISKPASFLLLTSLLVSPVRAEDFNFNLYINVGFIKVQSGTARIFDSDVLYNGRSAVRTAMEMSTDAKADRIYPIRDTVESYITRDGESLFFRKSINEGEKKVVETAVYSKDKGRFIVNMKKVGLPDKRDLGHATEWRESRIYDLMSMLNYARRIDTSGSEPGRTETLPMVNGDMVVQQYLVYTGNKTIKADDGKQYDCMIISVRDYKEGKERETLKAYVTNDAYHRPIQLDIPVGTGISIRALLK